MSTPIVTPTPTPAPTASVATAQANVNNVITQVMPYLTTQFSQGIIAAVAALSNPNNPGIANGFNAITAATQAVATLPGSAGVYAVLAGFIESIISTVIGGVETATKPAEVVANAHPPLSLKFFHPNIAKQEEAMAAAQTVPVAQVTNAQMGTPAK